MNLIKTKTEENNEHDEHDATDEDADKYENELLKRDK